MTTLRLCSLSAAACLMLVGCAGASSEDDTDVEGAALSAARAASATAFAEQMAELEARFDASAEDTSSSVSTKTIRPLTTRLAPMSRRLCDHLAKFRGLEHAYFYFGGYGSADVVVGAAVGMDVVYDLWNRQAATFSWKASTVNVGTAGSIAVGGYVGYGFGAKDNVIDAWAGRFDSVAVDVDIPLTKFGIEGELFRSPDGSVVGGTIVATAGLSLSWPLPVSASLETGFWVPFDRGTDRMASASLGARRSLKTTSALTGDPRIHGDARSRSYRYVQYEKSSDLALGLLMTAPGGVSLVPAAQAVAIGVLRDSGRIVEDLCPLR